MVTIGPLLTPAIPQCRVFPMHRVEGHVMVFLRPGLYELTWFCFSNNEAVFDSLQSKREESNWELYVKEMRTWCFRSQIKGQSHGPKSIQDLRTQSFPFLSQDPRRDSRYTEHSWASRPVPSDVLQIDPQITQLFALYLPSPILKQGLHGQTYFLLEQRL